MVRLLVKAVVFSGVALALGACGSSSSSNTAPAKTEFLTFVTAADFTGGIKAAGGEANAIASADKLCNTDSNKPNASSYKAMLVDGVNRVACTSAKCATSGSSEHVDWIFRANASYFRSDGATRVFKADANGVFDFGNYIDDLLENSFDTSGTAYWTGLDSGWTSIPGEMCGGSWDDGTIASSGDYGFGDRLNSGAIGGGLSTCENLRHLFCVEQ